MADIEQDLKNNIAEFIENGDDGLEKQRYNAAVDSYFKAIVILCDLKIFQLRRLLPKNHTERFLFLKVHFKDVYEIVSPLFKTYTDSYNLRMEKQHAEELKNYVRKVKLLFGHKENSE